MPNYPKFTIGPPTLTPDTPGEINRTEDVIVGDPVHISDVLLVEDPKYPWYEVKRLDGRVALAKYKSLREQQQNSVESYRVERRRYWRVVKVASVLEKQELEITYEVGFTTEKKDDFSSTLAFKLGLELKGGYGGVSGSLSSEFSTNLQTSSLERTVQEIREKRTIRTSTEPGFRVGWQLMNEFLLYRKRKGTDHFEQVTSVLVPENDLVWTGDARQATSSSPSGKTTSS